MCEGRQHQGRGHGYGRGRRLGFGRGGFPSPEEWVERLQLYRDELEAELDNVRDLMERLRGAGGDAPPDACAPA